MAQDGYGILPLRMDSWLIVSKSVRVRVNLINIHVLV